jgi:hypothetical protein
MPQQPMPAVLDGRLAGAPGVPGVRASTCAAVVSMTAAVDAEARVQLALTVTVGGVAACASWSHVLDLAGLHGQGGWLAWAVAACIETSAVSAALEVRRRRNAGAPVTFPVVVLVAATALQLAAQVAQAERSGWGVVLAAVPAVTFLVLVKLALSRAHGADAVQASVAVSAQVITPEPNALDVAAATSALSRRDSVDVPAAITKDGEGAGDAGPQRRPDPPVGELLLIGRAVADELARDGLPLNRRNLLAGIRARGRSCSSERASALLAALRAA